MGTPIERAISNTSARGLTPLLAVNVEDSGSKVFKRQRIVVLADFFFELYDKKGETLKRSFSWLKLTGFKIIEKTEVYIEFGNKKFQFTSPQFKSFVSGIVDSAQRFLTKNELSQMGFQTAELFKSKPTPISIIHRLEAKMKELKIDLQPETVQYIKDLIITERKIINFAEIPEADLAAPLFFDILQLMSFVSSVTLPPMICNVDAFDYISEFIGLPSYLRHLTIDCKVSQSFSQFIQKLKENDRSRITGLTFVNTEFTIDQLSLLTEALVARSITSLGFHNAISHPARIYFYSTFFQGEFLNNLKYLDITNTPNLDLRILLPKIRQICVLNLESCGIEISEIISAISSISLPSLREINVSNNPFTIPLSSPTSLPKSLTTFIANKITFPDNSLVTLISYLFAKIQKPLNLSIADALDSTDEWFRVFNFLEKCPFENLQSLTWDNNPTYPSLFEFLGRNKMLEYLSLSGCFYEANHGPIVCLADYLETASSLRTLILRGFNASILGKYTVAALTAMRNMSSLEHLDVSFNYGGDDELLTLKLLVNELPQIRTVYFDGCKSTNVQIINDLFKTCRCVTEDNKVSIIFPTEDMTNLKKKLIITDDQYETFYQICLQKPEFCFAQKKSCEYQRPEKSPLDECCVLPTDDYTLQFPLFLTRDEVLLLGGDENDDETVAPETVVIDYAVNDFENNQAASIASLNFNQSKSQIQGNSTANSSVIISTPTATSVRSIQRFDNDNESVASKKRAVASSIRRAMSEKAESVVGNDTPDTPRSRSSTKQNSPKTRGLNNGRSKTIISPFHHDLTAENVDRHSWEFPANYDIEFDQNVWKDAAAEFSIQSLFDEIRYEKSAIVHRQGDAQSVMSKRSKRSKMDV